MILSIQKHFPDDISLSNNVQVLENTSQLTTVCRHGCTEALGTHQWCMATQLGLGAFLYVFKTLEWPIGTYPPLTWTRTQPLESLSDHIGENVRAPGRCCFVVQLRAPIGDSNLSPGYQSHIQLRRTRGGGRVDTKKQSDQHQSGLRSD